MKLNDGFIGICNSFFPQYLINAIFEGDFQPVNPDKFSLSKSNLYFGLNIIYLNEFISKSDIIIANRFSDELLDVSEKVYSRDIFQEN